MNCINHPETPVEAYCQQCGKALCSQCVRSVAGTVSCEPCLAARLGMPPASGSYSVNAGDSNFQYTATGPLPYSAPYSGDAKPALAGILGIIPGVGAMYNGQFIKALVHVLVFAILVTIVSDGHGLFGLFIAAWVFYQIFDAHQTAKARRDGLPLPDPFGLNDLGARLGLHPAHAAVPPAAPYMPPAGTQQAAYDPTAYPAAGFVQTPESAAAYTAHDVPYPPVPPLPPMPRRSEPVGAIVLIILGIMFLFSSMGIFHMHWIGLGWPVILIVIGGWLIFRRTREMPNGGTK
jgi:TM2 domain-containing membrane protein YozV